MEFRLVSHGSDEYQRVVTLRIRILRKPLGLTCSASDLEAESAQIHIAGFSNASPDPIACVILADADADEDLIQVRQLAVAEKARRQGLGCATVAFAEAHARSLGRKRIFCHSRYYVVPFYEKLGYRMTGAPFQEVGMTHVRMEKDLI